MTPCCGALFKTTPLGFWDWFVINDCKATGLSGMYTVTHLLECAGVVKGH